MGENDDLFQELTKFIKDSNESQTVTLRNEIKKQVEKVKEEVEQLKETLEVETKKRKTIENNLKKQEEFNEQTQKALKKNNIIVWGLEYEDTSNLIECVLTTINTRLGLSLTQLHCNNIYPLGKGANPRPVVVQFISFLTKVQVLKESGKLKNFSENKISISEDLTREERAVRKILVKHKKIAVRQGNKAHIKGNFLYVNGEKFTADSLEDPLEEEEEELDQAQRSNSAPAAPSVRSNHRNSSSSSEGAPEISQEEKTKSNKDIEVIPISIPGVENPKKNSFSTQSQNSGSSLHLSNKESKPEKEKPEEKRTKPRSTSKSSTQSPAPNKITRSSQRK